MKSKHLQSKEKTKNGALRVFVPVFTLALLFLPMISLATLGGPIIPTECFSRAGGCGWNDLIRLGQNIMQFMIYLIPLVATIAFVWAGWLYMSSQGDQGKIKTAHKIFTTVAIGIFLTLGAWLLINTILTFLGVDSSYSLLG